LNYTIYNGEVNRSLFLSLKLFLEQK